MKETCAKLERQIADEKRKCKEFSEQLRLAKYNLEQNKHEFDEYKQKAQRILQVCFLHFFLIFNFELLFR
jgi:hypothetical protein